MLRNDWRLQFVNLKNETGRKNIIGKRERDKIWIPHLVFDNSVKDFQIKNDDFSSLMVDQNKNATKELNIYLQEDERYNGSENNLIYSRTYQIKLMCEFEQHNYPFDHQICKIKVIIQYFINKS